jgi:hypothetical protein
MAKESFDNYVVFEQQPAAKKTNWLVIVLVSVAVLAMLVSVGTRGERPAAMSSATPSQSTDVRNSSDCFIIRTDITMLRTSFSVGEDTPQQVSFLLEAARNDFSQAASSFTGSKAAWLEKMAELSGKVSLYIMTGSPEDGPQALDQLYANMNLVDQFCE